VIIAFGKVGDVRVGFDADLPEGVPVTVLMALWLTTESRPPPESC
jgi:hypothetical protein